MNPAPHTPVGDDGSPKLPEGDAERLEDLQSILWDYPNVEPEEELVSYAWQLSAAPAGDSAAGLIVVLHASCWYAASGRVRRRSVLDDMIGALDAALPPLGDDPCTHTAEEHPRVGLDPAEDAAVGIHLLSAAGRAVYERDGADEGWEAPLEGWLCPVFLRGLAVTARAHLAAGRDRLFGERDTRYLDPLYVHPDGRVHVEALTRTYRRTHVIGHDLLVQDTALWAARRYAAGTGEPRERTTLLLLACWGADGACADLPVAVVGGLKPVLEGVDLAPLSAPCPHPTGHPWSRLEARADRQHGTARARDDLRRLHLNHLCAPEEFEAPEGVFSPEEWSCPRHLAERAQAALDEVYEAERDTSGWQEET